MAEEATSVVQVTDPSGLTLYLGGPESDHPVTTPEAGQEDGGMLVPSPAGQFLLKDTVLVVAALLTAAEPLRAPEPAGQRPATRRHTSPDAAKCLVIAWFLRWARRVSNLRPLACEAR